MIKEAQQLPSTSFVLNVEKAFAKSKNVNLSISKHTGVGEDRTFILCLIQFIPCEILQISVLDRKTKWKMEGLPANKLYIYTVCLLAKEEVETG